MIRNLLTFLAAILISSAVYGTDHLSDVHAPCPVPAFPGAEGGGMFTTGGRGGKVLYVTRLDDKDTVGTLRWAVTRKYPRTVLFSVSGVINLEKRLRITGNDITIAGQSAPGDGICIAGNGVFIDADNVIIRFLRFRPGDENPKIRQEDALGSRYHRNIIIDHCSMSWSTDECASFYANENFTLQWCIMSESLRNSRHDKGTHGYGGIWGGKNASFHHNLLSCHDSRNPRFDHPYIYIPNVAVEDFRGNVDFRNNVIYNWGRENTYGGEGGRFNMVANYYKPGPATVKGKDKFITVYGNTPDVRNRESGTVLDTPYPDLYMEGNVMEGNTEITKDNISGVKYASTGGKRGAFLEEALPINCSVNVHTTTHTAEEAYRIVLDYAGVSLSRDKTDKRIIADVEKGRATCKNGGRGSTGGLIDTQSAVGGWPEYKSSKAMKDSDMDGIPDKKERAMGLDPFDPDDSSLIEPCNGYTYLEIYLNDIVSKITRGQHRTK